MRHVSQIVLAVALLISPALVPSAEAGQYRFAVKGQQVPAQRHAPFKVIGLRVSNALISDETAEQLIKNLDAFKDYGVNTVSVYVMGSHFGDVKGYKPDASLDPVYTARLARIIEAADQRGMVVLVGCLYCGHFQGEGGPQALDAGGRRQGGCQYRRVAQQAQVPKRVCGRGQRGHGPREQEVGRWQDDRCRPRRRSRRSCWPITARHAPGKCRPADPLQPEGQSPALDPDRRLARNRHSGQLLGQLQQSEQVL